MNASVQDVREALRDLADQGRLVDLSAGAMRRAKWIRCRRRSYVIVAALGIVFGLCSPAVRVFSLTDLQKQAAPSTTTGGSRPVPSVTGPMIALPGGWMVGSGPGMGQRWIYNRKTLRYQTVPYDVAIPAPVGNLVFVARDDGWAGVLDLRLNQINVLRAGGKDTFSLDPVQWSDDGLRLLHRDGEGQVFITDAAGGTPRDLIGICKACTELMWLPGGREFAASISGDVFDGMQVYSADTGAKLRKVPWARASAAGFTPDGSRLVAETAKEAQICVINVADDVTMSRFADGTLGDARAVYWADQHTMLAIVRGGVAVYSDAGKKRDFFPWPHEFRDAELREFTLIRQ